MRRAAKHRGKAERRQVAGEELRIEGEAVFFGNHRTPIDTHGTREAAAGVGDEDDQQAGRSQQPPKGGEGQPELRDMLQDVAAMNDIEGRVGKSIEPFERVDDIDLQGVAGEGRPRLRYLEADGLEPRIRELVDAITPRASVVEQTTALFVSFHDRDV